MHTLHGTRDNQHNVDWTEGRRCVSLHDRLAPVGLGSRQVGRDATRLNHACEYCEAPVARANKQQLSRGGCVQRSTERPTAMGATCSSCCWSDRRASDVLHDDDDADALHAKLLDPTTTGEYDCHSSTIEESGTVGHPYARSLELRMKDAWPRPVVTPTSDYAGGYDNSGRSSDGSDDQSSRRCGSSASSSSSPLIHAWNLREAGSNSDASFVDVQTLDDGASAGAEFRAPLPLDLALRTSESMRSSGSDSYASARELPTYESLLFADDVKKRSPQGRRREDSGDMADDSGDDEDDGASDRDRDSLAGDVYTEQQSDMGGGRALPPERWY